MRQPSHRVNKHAGFAESSRRREVGSLNWACPFFKENWKAHQRCVVPMEYIADVKHHLKRSHASVLSPEKLQQMFDKRYMKGTNEEKWFTLWTILFPGRSLPEMPFYTQATSLAELVSHVISDFKQRELGSRQDDRTLDRLTAHAASISPMVDTTISMPSSGIPEHSK
ncbi:hypothetical protein QBC47DRAFT_94720 [Echria macrotheca]|uniref:Uncharacterized protein n=1 Tax=Echria macrotheca TaxID=438768 RepID=A0AAJ0F740_9PEZI|nr:hypothetical protein QBC47DRAFT_94720 [Echria macrotheca]